MQNSTNEGSRHKYRMSVDLSVLDHLGLNLYSNAAAVLSELVANAYDADSTKITIDWVDDAQTIVIRDDGSGMTVNEINDRFLKVGYRKRELGNEGECSPKFRRKFMGRKGVGKLSVFSLAEVLEVYSVKAGEVNGFRIDTHDLTAAMEQGGVYYPKEIEVPQDYSEIGTTLVLTRLRKKRADLTERALRTRLARRFNVLADYVDETDSDSVTPQDESTDIFTITINGARLTWADRQELKHLQFIWEFGESGLTPAMLPEGVKRFQLENQVNKVKGWEVNGWFGSAKRPTDLTSDAEAGSLKNIMVLARKRPIQEGIIEKLDFSRVFGSYVTGQVSADFLDEDDFPDIATTDRQRLIEDDERVTALQEFLRRAFVAAAEDWSKERPTKESKNALDRYPSIKDWVEKLPDHQRHHARSMIGTIASLDFERGSEDQRKILFRAGIFAFERVGLRQTTEDLESLAQISAEELLVLLGRQDEYENGLWADILRSRIEAINQFSNLANGNEKEKVLQQHLFDNLWLLDASWERATGSMRLEESMKSMAAEYISTVDEEVEKKRVDIRYATTGGKHIVVELKRYSVSSSIEELVKQGGIYASSLKEVLKKRGDDSPHIEVVFVLGQEPRINVRTLMEKREYIRNQLKSINGRVVYYDQLIENALAQYEEYTSASLRANQIEDLLDCLS